MSVSDRRCAFRAPVVVAVKQRLGREVLLCQSADLSPEGMMLARVWDRHAATPRRCWLEFDLPGAARTIVARGALVREERRAPYQLLAFHFAALTPTHRRLIADYTAGAPRAAPLALA